MTNKEAIDWINYHIRTSYYEETDDLLEAFKTAIKALEQEACNNCISRQTVKELYYKDGYIDFRKICELPSVIPQPKTGHWIEKRYVGNDKYDFECSVCHCTDTHSKSIKVKHVKYCWDCGARMEVQGDETDN